MKNKIILTLLMLLAYTAGAWAQTATVTGTVNDADGPVIGATVQVKGTSIATATDFDGNFTLPGVNADKAVLEVRSVGYNAKEVALKGRTSDINIFLETNSTLMDEVVGIGYGTQKRGNLTGSMASVDAKAIERMPVANVGEAIVGRMPGVQVTTADGSPDAEITVRVRGGGSLTQSNEPLVLIDGFEGSLNDVPATDVEDIQVLKDAASTAIYGARGANGVVLVTTKKANKGKVQVSVNAYVKTAELSNKIDVLSPYDFVWANYERIRPKGASAGAGYANNFGQLYEMYIYQGEEGYDWQDIIFGTHPVSWSVDASINGGTDKFKYKLSYMHQDQPSVMPDNGLVQNNANLNLNFKPFKWLGIEWRTRYMDKTLSGRGTEGISLLTALQEQPTNGLQDYTSVPENSEIIDDDTFVEYFHYDPIETNRRYYRRRKSRLINLGGALTWTFMKGLTLRNEFYYEYFRESDRQFNAANSNSNSKTVGPNLTDQLKGRHKWQMTNVINWNFDLGVNDFQLMAGQEMKSQEENTNRDYVGYLRGALLGVPTDEDVTAGLAFAKRDLGQLLSHTWTHPSDVRILSWFGRVNYSYDDRYLATVTLRADGSSKFARGNRWGFFPAAALAWRLSNERFLKNTHWLSNLKLRLSFGMSGNDRIDSDLYIKLYKEGDASKASGLLPSGKYYEFQSKYPVNPNVKWETTITRNIGLDFGMFNGRIDGTVDVYWNTTKDLLLATQIPGDTGFTQMMTNIGQTSNRGIELNLNGFILEGRDYSLSANVNIGFNKGKIDKLSEGEESFYTTAPKVDVNDDVFWYRVGQKMGQIYGYVNDGFYTVDDFTYDSEARTYTLKPGVIDCSLLAGNLAPGSPKFKKTAKVDSDDPNANVLTADDRQFIGSTSPKISGGFGLNATYKGFDLAAFFNFMAGFDVINLNKINMSLMPSSTGAYRNLSAEFAGMWHRYDEMGNDMYRNPELMAYYNRNATMWNPANMTKSFISTYGVEDGSFLRLQTLTLGYSLPKSILRHIHMTKCRFYATGYNLFTITNYSGYDPEVNIGQGTSPNIDYNMYPRSRTYTFGVQLAF